MRWGRVGRRLEGVFQGRGMMFLRGGEVGRRRWSWNPMICFPTCFPGWCRAASGYLLFPGSAPPPEAVQIGAAAAHLGQGEKFSLPHSRAAAAPNLS